MEVSHIEFCLLAVDPLLLLDSFRVWLVRPVGLFLLDLCPRPGYIGKLEAATGLLAYEKGGDVYARALHIRTKSC